MSLAFEKYFLTHRKLLQLLRRSKKTSIERKQLFATAEKVWSLSSTWRKSSSSKNRKHSHTHLHTGRLLYPRYSPAAARVMTTKVLSSCPRIYMWRDQQIVLHVFRWFNISACNKRFAIKQLLHLSDSVMHACIHIP